ncbi:hypothetical protein BDFB_010229, partial [Asbolus verrucosus]
MIFNIKYQKNVFEIAAVFESVSTLGYLVTRKTMLLIHASLFEEMIQDRSRFWHYDLCGKRIGDKCRNQMALCHCYFCCISLKHTVIYRRICGTRINALIILVIISVGDIKIKAEKPIFGIYSIDWYNTGSHKFLFL